jgi:hypothetical protein
MGNEAMTDDMTPDDARRALAEVSARERGSAARLTWPWWYDPALGGLIAAIMIHTVLPMPFNVLLVAAACAGIALLIGHYQSQDVWVSGWRNGRTRAVSLGCFAGFLGLYGLSIGAWHLFGILWIPVAAAVAGFIGVIVFNHVWLAVWRREMAETDR